MVELADEIERVANETAFSGVVRVDLPEQQPWAGAYGWADRAHRIFNTVDTRLGIASGAKLLTALVVMRLVELGDLALSTTARSLLGADLPLIDDRVTVEHLLAHRSGIGDYLDEDAGWSSADYVMPVPVHQLATTEDFLVALDGYPGKFEPGERFSYCNGGFVVLALLAERAAGFSYHDLVDRYVCEPAGMARTEFLRMDELPGDAAVGYLDADGLRTNVLHLPVRGTGDGGVFSTVDDVHRLWVAFLAGEIVSPKSVARMIEPLSDARDEHQRYGLGVWLHESTDEVSIVGQDAGISFQSAHVPSRGVTTTVISNTPNGAWPIVGLLTTL